MGFVMSMAGGFVGAVIGYVAATVSMRHQPIKQQVMAAIAAELLDRGLAKRIAERLRDMEKQTHPESRTC